MKNGIKPLFNFEKIYLFFSLLASIGFFGGCASIKMTSRNPSSSHEESLAAQKNSFFINLLPENLRSQTILSFDTAKSFPGECRQSEYAPWLYASNDSSWISQKKAFLLEKLNRPFYSYYFVDEMGLHVFGRPEDFKELFCISFALSDGRVDQDNSVHVYPDFIQSALKQPTMTFSSFEILLKNWETSFQDMETGKMLIDNSNFTVYDADDFLTRLTNSGNSSAVRSTIIKFLVQANVYKSNSQILSRRILQQAAQAPNDERYAIVNMLLSTGASLDRDNLLNFAVSNPLKDKDYLPIYEKLATNQTVQTQVNLFLKVLGSDATISNGDSIFLGLLATAKDTRTENQLIDFIIFNNSSFQKLKKETFLQVFQKKPSYQFSTNQIQGILQLIRDNSSLDLDTRYNIFSFVCTQSHIDSATVVMLIDDAMVLRSRQAPEDKITSCVVHFGSQYKNNLQALDYYKLYWNNFAADSKKNSIALDFLSIKNFDEKFLLNIVQTALKNQDENTYKVLKLALSQESLTADGLDRISVLMSNRIGKLSSEDKNIISSIDMHPLANDQIKARDKKTLGGVKLEYIQDPDKF